MKKTRDAREGPQPPLGRDELNLAEFPITLLADRAPRGVKTVTYKDTITDKGTGKLVEREVLITGSDAYGLPTAHDDDVIVALMQITWFQTRFESANVNFTRYELAKMIRWGTDGRTYKRINASLNRWLGVSLYYDKAWWDPSKNLWRSVKFHILDNVVLTSKGDTDVCMVKWNDVMLASFAARFIRPIDTDLYFSLKSSIAKRLFRYLDKHRYHGRFSFDLNTLAFQKLGMSVNYDTGQIKRKLKGAIDELVAAKFLKELADDKRYQRKRAKVWTIFLPAYTTPQSVPRATTAADRTRAISDYWEKLSEDERKKLEDDALAEVPSDYLDGIEFPPMRKMMLRCAIDEHIARTLGFEPL